MTRISNVQSFRAHADQVGFRPIGKIGIRSPDREKSVRFPGNYTVFMILHCNDNSCKQNRFSVMMIIPPLHGYVINAIPAETPNLTVILISRIGLSAVFQIVENIKLKKTPAKCQSGWLDFIEWRP